MCRPVLLVLRICQRCNVVSSFCISKNHFGLVSDRFRCVVSAADFDFKIRGSRGDLLIAIRYVPELRAFTGVGRQGGEGQPSLTFCFYQKDSLLTRLPKIP
jgi:hypothetical protein